MRSLLPTGASYAVEFFVDSTTSEEEEEVEEHHPTTTTSASVPGATKEVGLPRFKDQVLLESNEGSPVNDERRSSGVSSNDPTGASTTTSGNDITSSGTTSSLQADESRENSSLQSHESSFQMSGLTVNSPVPSFANRAPPEEQQASMTTSSPEPIIEDQQRDDGSDENENTGSHDTSTLLQPVEASLVRESFVVAEVVNQSFGARCMLILLVLLIIGGILSAVLLPILVFSPNGKTRPLPTVPQTLRPSGVITESPTVQPTFAPTPQPTFIPVDPVSWIAVQELQGTSTAVNFGASLGTTNKGWKILVGYDGGVHFWEKLDDASSTIWSLDDNRTAIGRLSFDGTVAVYVASDPVNGTIAQIVRRSEDEMSWAPYFGGIPPDLIQPSERYWLNDQNDEYGEFLALAQQGKNVTAIGGVGFVKVFARGRVFELRATLQEPSVSETHQFGWSVDVDAYGTLVVVGAPSVSPCCTGMVFVYRWNGTSFMLEDQLEGITGAGRFGHAVKLSGDGNLLLVGGTLQHNGHVIAYIWEDNHLVQRGSLLQLHGTSTTNGFGTSLGANYNGTKIAIGHPLLDDSVGSVFMYQWNGEDWAERGDEIVGLGSKGGCFGSTISMTREGDAVIVSAPKEDRGKVYVFEPFLPENPFACRVCKDGADMLNPNRALPDEVISPDFKQITGGVKFTCYLIDLVGQNKYLPSACPVIEELFYSFCGCEDAPAPVVCDFCESPEQIPSNYDRNLPQSLVRQVFPDANFQITCGNVFEAGRQGSFFTPESCQQTVAGRKEFQAFCGCS